MARNGAGTYSKVNTFVAGNTVTAAGHNQNWDDLVSEVTNSVAADGQTVITGALKGANGTVSLPAYSFNSDLDSGMYRIGANNLGLAVNGAKVVDIATTGVVVTGTLSSSGTLTATGQATASAGILNSNGTVSLPSYSFTGDTNSGVYWIGADNLGIAVNGAKVVDVATTGINVIGTVQANGTVLTPAAQAVGMINGTIVESHTGNAVTFALKTLANADPSATDPVTFIFRNATAATGNYVVLQATAAMSLVISSGSTMGTANSTAFKLWLVMFNDASTLRMGAINCVSGTSIYPLGQFPLASSTAEGGAGAADSAQVFYTGTAVTTKAYIPIAHASYESGLATAGSWAASPTRLQLHGVGQPLPGAQIQVAGNQTGAVNSGSTTIPNDDTIPQNTEGDQYLTQSITPTSATNILRVSVRMHWAGSAATAAAIALFQDSTASALSVGASVLGASSSNIMTAPLLIDHDMLAATTSSTTFNCRAGNSAGAGTITFNGVSAGRKYGGVLNSFIRVTEIMT